jgi:hypothetical protein
MVFALETYWPASDGWSAARIEEELVVTKDGCEVITRFPAEELLVVGKKYYTATGPLSETRETQSHKNIDYTGVDYGGAGWPDGYVPVGERSNGKKTPES